MLLRKAGRVNCGWVVRLLGCLQTPPLDTTVASMVVAERLCPQCGAVVVWGGNPCRPFCSERCRLIDLSNWMGERYRIPGKAVDDETERAAESEEND